MGIELGRMIQEFRERNGLTQDNLGRRYDISGPAVFKFEKGYVNPSLELWKRIAADMGLGEPEAVLIWVRAKLPEEHQSRIDLASAATRRGKGTDLAQIMERDKLRAAALADPGLPAGLRALVKDDEVWRIVKPTGRELNLLKEMSRAIGDGRKGLWRNALLVLRSFYSHEE